MVERLDGLQSWTGVEIAETFDFGVEKSKNGPQALESYARKQ